VANYDLAYFYEIAVPSPDRRKHLSSVEDLAKVDDVDLLRAALQIGLLWTSGQGGTADESACTPGSVPARLAAMRWAAIHLGLPSPAGSSGLPADSGGPPSNACAGTRKFLS